MMLNPFNAIYKQCNSGKMADKMANLREFPIVLDIELTNYCNLKCTMCPTGRNILTRPKGFMSKALFEKILVEAHQYNTAIRFVRWGEPLYHPMLLKFIAAVKSCGLLCHINTNAQLIDDDFISEIIRLKLDSIKFSFQGVNKFEYEKIRRGADFLKTLGWLKELYLRRGKRSTPFILVGTTVSKKTKEEDILRFKEAIRPYCDKITVGITKDLFSEKQTTNYPECPEVFDKMSINWDGIVTACCADYDNQMVIGDLNKNSLKEIWNSDRLNFYRKMLIERRHGELPLCSRCVL